MTLPIRMYGSHTCEDTAISRDRLNVLRVAFQEFFKEDDESVVALLGKYNQGMTRTPTLVFGDDEIVIAEPTFEQLEESLSRAGYGFNPPRLHAFDFKRYIPDFSKLAVIRSPDANSRELPKTFLFFAHAPACRVCQGYAKQIAAQRAEFEHAGARLQIVLDADNKQAKKWGEEFSPGVDLILDPDGMFKRRSVDCFPDTWDVRPGGAWLMLVDRGEVIRAGVYAADAGGLVAPTEIMRYLTEQYRKVD